MRVLITGINGQDGSYLAELLLSKGHEVYGVVRRHSAPKNQTTRLEAVYDRISPNLYYGDVCDLSSLLHIFEKVRPEQVYNLAAQSHVQVSFAEPSYTIDTIVKGTLNILECIRVISPYAKLYQASSSDMFGNSTALRMQSLTTPMCPVSPYGIAKLAAHTMVDCYRHAHGVSAVNGVLFNHESPRRADTFVSKKIVAGAVAISKGLSKELVLGNLKAQRDWGHAKDYVAAMYAMMNTHTPKDYVVATGTCHSVAEVVDYVFGKLKISTSLVRSDKKYLRPHELHYLCGDSSPIREELKWAPSYTFESLLDEMITSEL